MEAFGPAIIMEGAKALDKSLWVKNDPRGTSNVNSFFEELDGSHYKQGIEVIKYFWKKCIES